MPKITGKPPQKTYESIHAFFWFLREEHKEARVFKACGFLAITKNANFSFCMHAANSCKQRVVWLCQIHGTLLCCVGNVGYCFICTPQPPELPVSEADAMNVYKNANKFINLQWPLVQCMSAITIPS